jgi:hypothetical protein
MLGIIFHRGLLSPIFLHFFIWAILSDVNAPTGMLCLSLGATFFVGLLLSAAELPLVWVLVLCAWFPGFTSATDFYWKIDSASPHSSFLLPSDGMSGRGAYVAFSALVGGLAWLVMRKRSFRKQLKYFSWRDFLDE